MIGMYVTMRYSWMDRISSASAGPTKGPSPWKTPQIVNTEKVNRQALAPPGPKRTAAQSRNGSGTNRRMLAVGGRTGARQTTSVQTRSRPNPRSAPSARRGARVTRIAFKVSTSHGTIAGTSVRMASAFEKNRPRHSVQ
jgi:hypothetical protein